MPLNLASPGVRVREVDLTVGRVDPTSDKVAAIVAPFAQGPVEVPTLVENESDLLANFGEAYEADRHYEHWMVASSYLSYGGNMRIVRADDADMKNAYGGSTVTAPKIRSLDHYVELGYDENTISGVTVAARNPGSWGNDMVVAIIDGRADQIVSGVVTSGITIGMGVTQAVPAGTVVAGVGTTSLLDGFFKGVVTAVGTESGLSSDTIHVKLVQHVTAAGVQSAREYQEGGVYKFYSSDSAETAIVISDNVGVAVSTDTSNTVTDWFNQQEITLTGDNISWNQIADRPATSSYAAARGSRFDEVHVVVIDDKGTITGNPGTILEKHIGLSKAKDAQFVNGSANYYRQFAANGSGYIFLGGAPSNTVDMDFQLNVGSGFTTVTDTAWDQNAQGISFAGAGNRKYTLAGGLNYGGSVGLDTTGSLKASIGNLNAGYDKLLNADEYDVDFVLQGSGNWTKEEAQAIGLKAINIAETRTDALAFLSPARTAIFNESGSSSSVRDSETITDNIIAHFSPIASSSFAVFDSGYKYMYDRFADKFRYVPLNGDIAGTCVRTDIVAFPWFSPAGTTRGAILNAVKVPYNPTKAQRDRLYSNRVNPVTFLPGSGIVLYGDKTGQVKQSAFDRINVRRLFLYVEKAIATVARDQLFEFNDEVTRTNFVNAVEPFLREVQSNRGIDEFIVVCDQTNNTAAVIDRNEFVADIFIKPARSINFIGLTFVATRTGVSFEEIVGNV